MTEVELHIHVKKDGKMLITPEKIRLLQIISITGSLLTASKEMGVSYNKAWNLLDSMNKSTNTPVVEKSRGGKGGGGAILTNYGKLILQEYGIMEKIVLGFAKKLNSEINF